MAELPVLGALKGVSEGRDVTILAKVLNIPINPQFGGDIIDTNEDGRVIKFENINFCILGPTQRTWKG